MKRFRLATVLLSLIGISLASSGFTQECEDYFLGPLMSNNYSVKFRALHLQPCSSNLHYAVEGVQQTSTSCPNWEIHGINPGYNFGFDVGLGWLFTDCNLELTFDWEHFQSKDHASKKVKRNHTIGPFFGIGQEVNPYTRAKGKVNFDYDSVHFDYGIFVGAGENLQAKLFAGVNIARISQKLKSKFSDCRHSISKSILVPSRYTGVGPELGIDFTYCLCYGLQFTGGAKAALLVGDQKNHTKYKSGPSALSELSTEVTSNNKQGSKYKHHCQVVPALEATLGIAYAFTCFGNLSATVEAGYDVKCYINAIQSTDISNVQSSQMVSDSHGVQPHSFHKTLSNFALSGPYLSINVVF